MSGDIEDFLRRAAQRRAKRSSNTPIVIDEQGQMQQQAPQAPQPPAPAAPKKQPAASRERVSSTIGSRNIDTRASVSSDLAERAHQRREQQMHRKFDHQVGSLDHEDEIVSLEDADVSASQHEDMLNEFASMLKDPKSVRQAIILSEIMTPPSHRW